MSSEKPARVYWPWAVGLVFLVGVGLNIALVVIARSPPPLVRKDYYSAGMQYQQEIDGNAEQARWRIRLDAGAETGSIRLCVHTRAGQAVDGAVVHVMMVRMSGDVPDQELSLLPEEAGCYVGRWEPNAPGAWRMEARLERGQERAHTVEALWVRSAD